MKTTRWALLLVVLGTAANGAEVYRSTDANGVTKFSDRPDSDSQAVTIATPRPGRPGNTVSARPAAPNPASADQAQPGAAPADAPQQTAAEREAQRTKNCAIARERAEKYTVSHRLYRQGANGEREYLNAGEIDEARNRAAADVATWCG